MHQYFFAYLLIALAAVFLGLGYWRTHRLGAGWRGWLAWGLAAVIAGLAAYPNFISFYPEKPVGAVIRVDLVLINRILLPFLSLLALVGIMKAILDTRAIAATNGKENKAGATEWQGLGLRLIAGGRGLKRPLWVGLIFAPLAGVVAFFVLVSLVLGARPPGSELSSFLGAFVLDFLLAGPVSYIGTLLFGPFLVIGLRKAGVLGFRSLTLGALPLGGIALPGWLAWLAGPPEEFTRAQGSEGVKVVKGWAYLQEVGWAQILEWFGVGAAMGLAVAVTFCWLTGVENSDPGGSYGKESSG